MKWLELCFHLRPRRLWDLLRYRDPFRRRQLLWTYFHIGMVWLGEIGEFIGRRFFIRQLRRTTKVDKVRNRRYSRLPFHAPKMVANLPDAII